MHWVIKFLQGGLDNVTKSETERDFIEVCNVLKAAPEPEVGVILCCFTCLRLGFESNGGVPRQLFENGNNPIKEHAKAIQSNFSIVVHRNYRKTGDKTARLAGLILLCSIRAVAYPEFIPQAKQMWELLKRGQSKAGMDTFMYALQFDSEADPVAVLGGAYYVPPIFAKE